MELVNNIKRSAIKFALKDGEKKDELLAKYPKKEKVLIKKENQDEKKEKKHIFAFFRKDELEEGYANYYTEDEEIIQGIIVSKDLLLDENFNSFGKVPTGNSLLKRNLNTSKLYLDDEGNILEVNSIKRVYPFDEVSGKAYVLLDTKYDNFILEFDLVQIF